MSNTDKTNLLSYRAIEHILIQYNWLIVVFDTGIILLIIKTANIKYLLKPWKN